MAQVPTSARNARLRCPGGAGRPSQMLTRNQSPRRRARRVPPDGAGEHRAVEHLSSHTVASRDSLGGADKRLRVEAGAACMVGRGHLRTRNTPSFKQSRIATFDQPTEVRPQSAPAFQTALEAAIGGQDREWTMARRQYAWRNGVAHNEPHVRLEGPGWHVLRRPTDATGAEEAAALRSVWAGRLPNTQVSEPGRDNRNYGQHSDHGTGQQSQEGRCRYSLAPRWSARRSHRLLAGHYEKVRLQAQAQRVSAGTARLGRHTFSEDAVFRKSDGMKYL